MWDTFEVLLSTASVVSWWCHRTREDSGWYQRSRLDGGILGYCSIKLNEIGSPARRRSHVSIGTTSHFLGRENCMSHVIIM